MKFFVFLFLLLSFLFSPSILKAQESQNYIIHMTKYGFTPQKLEVISGSKIQFINDDREAHYPISDTYRQLNPGKEVSQTYDFVADQKGSWNYYDKLNPTHKGILIVDQTSYRTPLPIETKVEGKKTEINFLESIIEKIKVWIKKTFLMQNSN